MNRMKHLLTAFVVLAALVGCGKKVDVTLNPSTIAIAPEGGTVEVTLTSNGEWKVEAFPEWLVIRPTSGKGDATLTLTAPSNNSEETRSGEVRVTTKDNAATLMVTQEPSGNLITVNPTEIDVDENGGSFEVTVTSSYQWTVNNTTDWIHCEPTSGNGNGTITVTIDPIENDINNREANINIVGSNDALASIRVRQQFPTAAGISVTPEILPFESTGGTKQATVHSNSSWTASCDADWITLSETSGTGDANISVSATENIASEARTAYILFLTETGENASLTIIQEGTHESHFLVVNPTEFYFGKEGGSAEIAISCDTEWTVDFGCSWASLSTQAGTGNSTITLTVEPNTESDPRFVEFKVISGTLSTPLIANQEAGGDPLTASFDPGTLYPGYNGGFQHVNLLSNTSWHLDASSWITLVTTSGNGDASLDIVVDGNDNPDERTGYVNARHNGQLLGTLTIIQEGKPNIFETDFTEMDVLPEGGNFTLHLTSNQSWTINCDVDWLTCSPESGSGSSDIVVHVDASSSPRPRKGHIKIVGSMGAMILVTVSQHG